MIRWPQGVPGAQQGKAQAALERMLAEARRTHQTPSSMMLWTLQSPLGHHQPP